MLQSSTEVNFPSRSIKRKKAKTNALVACRRPVEKLLQIFPWRQKKWYHPGVVNVADRIPNGKKTEKRKDQTKGVERVSRTARLEFAEETKVRTKDHSKHDEADGFTAQEIERVSRTA
jgi:hypothetical protein